MEKNKLTSFIKSIPNRLKEYFKNYFKNLNYPVWICFILLSIGLFLLDYFSKINAYYDPTLQSGGTVTFIPGILEFYLVGNSGAAWGSMSGWSWFLIPVSMIATIALTINLLFRFRKYNWGMTIGISFMLPGACGNLIDRIGYAMRVEPYDKGVIDFLKFSFWPSFPICNVADYCLTIGIVILLIGFVFEFKKEWKQMKLEEEMESKAVKTEEEIKEDDEMKKKLSSLENKEQEDEVKKDSNDDQ